MANDLRIKIIGTLNSGATITELNSALQKIESKINKINVNVNINDKQLNEALNQINKIQNQLKSGNSKIISDRDVNSIKEVYSSIEKAVEKYSQLGQVKISQNINPVTKEIEAFQLQVTRATGEVDKLKFELASLKGIQGINGFVLTNQSSTDNTEAIRERQLQQEQSINRVIEQRRQELQQQLQLYQRQAEIQASALRNNPNKIISSDQQIALTNYLNNIRALNTTTPELQQRMRQLSLDFREISSQTLTAGRNATTFGQALQTAFEKFPIWMVASTAFFQTFNFFKDGINYVNELNKSLTEISIVTGESQQQVAALAEQYNKLGQSMGVTTDDITKEAAELYRQGLTEDQVAARMKTITEYAKISSLDTKTASEIMTAAINSMGVSAQKAADVWSYMGDATATGKHMCPVLQ
jgi:hypothetical protein